MKKTILYLLICIIVAIFGILIGWTIYNITMIEDKENIKLSKVENDVDINKPVEQNLIDVSVTEEKVTPNTKLFLKTYYKLCGHSLKQEIELPSDMINMTKEELTNEFKQWTVESFSAKEVVLQKEEEGICSEHYILKEENGYIAIFWLDANRNVTLREVTDITTEYLPEFDLENLKKGIEIYGKDNLYMTIEDYE